MAFNMVIHHCCKVGDDPTMQFRGRRIFEKRGLEYDRWGLFECEETVTDLGYSKGKFKMWWRTREDVKDAIFRPIVTDTEAMTLAPYAIEKNVVVELFVEHDEEELINFTPLSIRRPPPRDEAQS